MTAAETTPDLRAKDHLFLEQWPFEISPLGTLATSVLIFLAAAGSFLAAAALGNYPIIVQPGLKFSTEVWPAFVLSVLVGVALGMQRYARKREIADDPAMELVLKQRAHYLARMSDADAFRRIRIGGAIGAAIGFGMSFVVTPPHMVSTMPVIFAWFCAAITIMGILFGRGVARSMLGAENFAQAIENDMIVDLLRADKLTVIGNIGARNALIWFSVCAVLLLFFAGENIAGPTLATLMLSTFMGIWIFVRPMERVHYRVATAKRTELEHIRSEIAEARAGLGSDPHASSRLQGLLAYEHRIEAVREWPFDQTTIVRLGAYVFIPAIPWFGQAIAQYFVDHIAVVAG